MPALPASPRALFLDRDGTIMFDKEYLADPAGVELIPGAADALRRARALGYRLFLFNQYIFIKNYFNLLLLSFERSLGSQGGGFKLVVVSIWTVYYLVYI